MLACWKVANGASDLFAEVFGDKGVHARTAVGVNMLPRGVPVEIDAIVEVDGAPPIAVKASHPPTQETQGEGALGDDALAGS